MDSKVTLHYEAFLMVERKKRALAKAEDAQSKIIKKMPLNKKQVAEYADITHAYLDSDLNKEFHGNN